MSTARAKPKYGQPHYEWQWPVRFVHWVLFFSIIALTVTGLYVSHPFVAAPGESAQRFVMGWMRTIHYFAAMAFSLAVLIRMVFMFIGTKVSSRWTDFVPTTRARWRELFALIRFYAWPTGKYPHEGSGHNALAGLTYLGFYLIAIGLCLTGFALHAVEARSGVTLKIFSFLVPLLGGAARARWLHHVLMWCALLFAILHVYMALFVARLEKRGLLDSIVTGWEAR